MVELHVELACNGGFWRWIFWINDIPCITFYWSFYKLLPIQPWKYKYSQPYVVVQFYPWFNFYFPLFLCMVMYDNEWKTKENKNETKDKILPQHAYTPPF